MCIFNFLRTSKTTSWDSIDQLKDFTIASHEKFRKQHPQSLLFNNNISKCDSMLFAAFLLRVKCIGMCSTPAIAEKFDNSYINCFKRRLCQLCSNLEIGIELFNNRLSFYDRLYMKYRSNPSKAISILTEEFEYIIATDYISQSFESFSEESPLPLVDILEQITLQRDASAYVRYITSSSAQIVKDVRNVLKYSK